MGQHIDLSPKGGIAADFSKRNLSEYLRDLPRSILSEARGKGLVGLCKEIHEDPRVRAEIGGIDSRGINVPLAVLERALVVGTFSAGGALVEDDLRPAEPYLRKLNRLAQVGATFITGIAAHGYTVPRFNSDITLSWGAESATASSSDLTVGQFTGVPNRLMGQVKVSEQILSQNEGSSEMLLESIGGGIGSAVEAAGINGSGVLGEPLGILSQTGTNAVDAAGVTMTLAKTVSIVSQISAANGKEEEVSLLMNGDVAAKWKQIQRWTNASVALMTDDNKVLGTPALCTANCPSGRFVAGVWRYFVVLFWGPSGVANILVDPFTASLQGQVAFTVNVYADCGALRPNQFSVATSSSIL